jgi:hypothetical protein
VNASTSFIFPAWKAANKTVTRYTFGFQIPWFELSWGITHLSFQSIPEWMNIRGLHSS